ncbi:hypothetical protein SAMN02745150_01316 [Brevinema andersonii]|uniref:Uncharacterized protein n=1 Tax=Brevinema andersonii TaxID=34097 RepID=A0A1I1EXP7_BREAD|nr:hypothetical protein [Brevinema andersonii]SFB91959.1 hypothetical protein SAMN02745150_01316 [Brevinema andersonii]
MLYIQHRVNTIPELELIAHDYGVEVDIRAYQDHLVLHHMMPLLKVPILRHFYKNILTLFLS